MTIPSDSVPFPGATPRPWGLSGGNLIVTPTREEVRQRMAANDFPITSKRICSTANPTYMTPEEEMANRDLILAAVNSYDALRTERDALKAEVQRLREAGEAAREWLEDIVPAVGGSWLKEYYAEGCGPEIREVLAQLTAALRVS